MGGNSLKIENFKSENQIKFQKGA
ncbi:unnamed protein product [Spirodela intermedia]|uniref:Uncharacterized protein n=1 Tax=Spirodela intermedia TaxID=51605 RepID=A0A7I8JU66_SPIIN|nr:unnamed protein product [Spirodela intermedia]CAA6673730.1 unnamed protein product [Spirodela intermedia]